MIVYKCDRCGKEIKKPKYLSFPAAPSWATRLINHQQSADRMLCAECMLSFANWFKDSFLYDEYKEMYKNEFEVYRSEF